MDLEPVVRDAALLNLPLAPLCRPDCAGPAPEALPVRRRRRGAPTRRPPPRDPRWAALASCARVSTDTRPGSTLREAPATLSRLRCRALAPRHPRSRASRISHGRPQEEDLQGEEPQPPGQRLDASRRPARSICPRCGAAKVPHVVCGNCGWYAGRQAVDVD